MPLPTTHYSRLNLRYLTSRYAGTTFMLLALGLLAGLAYRYLIQPTRYSANAEVAVAVASTDNPDTVDWNAKLRDWRFSLTDKRDWGLLSVNLRHALKLATTEGRDPDTVDLSATLAEFNTEQVYSGIMFHNRFLQRLGPVLKVARRDLAKYLDFQSLAMIASDLTPPAGKTDWDFSFFKNSIRQDIGTGVIANPDANDPFFKVFYHLYELIQGRPPLTAHAAWQATVDEISERIDREASYIGGGGFGQTARRELIREIDAMPVLAQNGLYHANDWFTGDIVFKSMADIWAKRWSDNSILNLISHGRNEAVVGAGFNLELRPVTFQRDVPETHITPLATAVLINFLAARENAAVQTPLPPATAEAEELPDAEADYVAELEELPVAPLSAELEPPEDPTPPEPTYVEMYDEVAAKQQQSLIRMHEEAVKLANVERDAVLRQLHSARAASNRLSHEAITARNRADKLRERYDQMASVSENDSRPRVPAQTVELFQRRDELLQRLVSLREYCTEEHPFVKLALRDLRVVEGLLADHTPDAQANQDAEARATRLANLYLEWETATSQAEAFEERARRHDDDIACLLDEITNLERCITQREIELAQAKAAPVPIVRVAVAQPAPVVPPVIVVAKPAPPPKREVRITPAAPVATAVELRPRLTFAQLPHNITEQAWRPGWDALLWGLLAGLLLSLLWALLRELFADRFRNVGEAHRLVGLPVLASLPAYDQRSVSQAADTVKGELIRTRPGRLQFMPLPVESVEPAPEGRRGKIVPARIRWDWRWLGWILGILFLALAGFLYYCARDGYLFPTRQHPTPLALPAQTIPVWLDETAPWGNRP